MNCPQIKKIIVLKCSLLLFCTTTMNHFLIGLWHAMKNGFLQQLAMAISVVGPRRSSKALPKAKLAPKKGLGHCLVVCCLSDLLQLSESQENCYIWEVCSANRWNALKLATLAPSIGQQDGPDSSSWQCMSHNQCFKNWMNWAMKLCLINHIQHLTSYQQTASSSSILTTFCKENASTTSRRQKILPKNSANPKAWIFMPQE